MTDYIFHFGIRGQKWGVKNGPPYPLDSKISTGRRLKKQQKINFKESKKIFKDYKSKSGLDSLNAKSTRLRTTNLVSNIISNDEIIKIREYKKEYEKALKKFDELEKQYEKWNKKAYDEAYEENVKWFKNNKPDILNLYDYPMENHEFRKSFEGLHSKKLSEIVPEYYFNSYINYSSDVRLALGKISSLADDIAERALGKYGKKKVSIHSDAHGRYQDFISRFIDADELSKLPLKR